MIGQLIKRGFQLELLEQLMDEASSSNEYCITYADLTCRVWLLNGWCPYCGSKTHGRDNCHVIAAYERERARDGDQ